MISHKNTHPEFEKVPVSLNTFIHTISYEGEHFDAPWHYHPELEITYILSGKGTRFVGDHAEPYDAHDLALIPPELPHYWKSDINSSKSRALVIQFNFGKLKDIIWNFPEMENIKLMLSHMSPGLTFGSSKQSERKFKQIHTNTGTKRFISLIELLSHLSELSYNKLAYTEYPSVIEPSQKNRMEKIYNLIQKNFKNNVNANYFANEVGLTRESFSKYFKQKAGIQFIKFLNEYRINYACMLLRETHLKIIEIAYESGFANLSNFNRQFLKLKNMSPNAYRKKLNHN